MFVCEYCLRAIESHEGHQVSRKVYYLDVAEDLIHEDEEGEETMTCEWCDEEIPVDEMYLI